MNPYAIYLGSRDPGAVIAETAGRLAAIVHALGESGAEQKPAPGKWSAREILCHLADCEIVFAFRLRQTLAQPGHTIQPFDQERWAERYENLTLNEALDVFSAVRRWNIVLFENASPQDRSTSVNHPERGDMTFQAIVETMAGHDLNHIGQLEAILATAASA